MRQDVARGHRIFLFVRRDGDAFNHIDDTEDSGADVRLAWADIALPTALGVRHFSVFQACSII